MNVKLGFAVIGLALLTSCSDRPQSAQYDQTTPPEARTSFELGTHYQRLPVSRRVTDTLGKTEVVEIFWYGCPHCEQFEPALREWLRERGDAVEFVRIPAVFSMARLHAQAFYTAEALGKSEIMHDAFFAEILHGGNPLDTEEKLARFFARFGVDAERFKQAFNSPAVQEKLQQAGQIARDYRMTYVPLIAINGQYVSDPSQAGSQDALIQWMTELTAHEHHPAP